MKLQNRVQAGNLLSKLIDSKKYANIVILAMPRGGVIVGAQIAMNLKIPLDLIITTRIMHPKDPNRAIAAIAEQGNPVFASTDTSDIELAWLNEKVRAARELITSRHLKYHNHNEPLSLQGKTVILVDDGILTGISVLAAIEEIHRLKADKIILATPSLPFSVAEILTPIVHKLVVLNVEDETVSNVLDYYQDAREIDDDKVVEVLAKLHQEGLYL